jgi:hypothetical protein
MLCLYGVLVQVSEGRPFLLIRIEKKIIVADFDILVTF